MHTKSKHKTKISILLRLEVPYEYLFHGSKPPEEPTRKTGTGRWMCFSGYSRALDIAGDTNAEVPSRSNPVSEMDTLQRHHYETRRGLCSPAAQPMLLAQLLHRRLAQRNAFLVQAVALVAIPTHPHGSHAAPSMNPARPIPVPRVSSKRGVRRHTRTRHQNQA